MASQWYAQERQGWGHRDGGRGGKGGRPAANQHAATHMAMMGMLISHAEGGRGKGLDFEGRGEGVTSGVLAGRCAYVPVEAEASRCAVL